MTTVKKQPLRIYNPANSQWYYAYENNVRLANGWKGKTYYFSRALMPKKALSELPEEYEVVVMPDKNALFARKKEKFLGKAKYNTRKKNRKDIKVVYSNEN